MGGGDIDAGNAVKGSGSVRNHGGRAQFVKNVDFNAIRGKNLCGNLGKFCRMDSGVATDEHTPVCRSQILDILGQAFGGCADGVDIHGVQSRHHDTA